MEPRVIYPNEDGGIVILVPTPEALMHHTIQEIAEKDVPAGVPFKIVDVTDIPSDRTFRNAWTVDPTILTDGVGSDSFEFPAKPVVEEQA